MVLEKAYAKLHHNWDAIDGGFAGQAVKDMTGPPVTLVTRVTRVTLGLVPGFETGLFQLVLT